MEPSRARAGLSGALQAGLPALLTLWAVLVWVLLTNPVRPYATGGLLEVDLLAFLAIGVAAGVLRPLPAAIAGVVVGATAAFAIQLYVLVEQASYNYGVFARVPQPPWSGQIEVAVAIAVATLSVGCVVGGATRRIVRRRVNTTAPVVARSSWTVTATCVVAAIVVVAVAVGETSRSVYVPDANEPTVRITIDGQRVANVAPARVDAGRTSVVVEGTDGVRDDIMIAGPLSAAARAQIEVGGAVIDVGAPTIGVRDDGGRDRMELTDAGTYAAYIVSGPSLTDHGEPIVILGARFFEVAGSATPVARPMTSLGLTLAATAGLLVAALAAGAAVLWARRRRWLPDRPRRADLTAALIAGAANGGILWFLARFAIDLSHNPF